MNVGGWGLNRDATQPWISFCFERFRKTGLTFTNYFFLYFSEMESTKKDVHTPVTSLLSSISILSNIVVNSGQGSTRTTTTISANGIQYGDGSHRVDVGEVPVGSSPPELHLPEIQGDLGLENGMLAELEQPGNVGTASLTTNDDDDFQQPPPPTKSVARARQTKKKVKVLKEVRDSKKRSRPQLTTDGGKVEKVRRSAGCGSELKKLLSHPSTSKGAPGNGSGIGIIERNQLSEQTLRELSCPMILSPMPISGTVSSEERQAGAVPVLDGELFEACFKHYDSMIERVGVLEDAINSRTASIENLTASIENLRQQLSVLEIANSQDQFEVNGIRSTIVRWRDAFTRRTS